MFLLKWGPGKKESLKTTSLYSASFKIYLFQFGNFDKTCSRYFITSKYSLKEYIFCFLQRQTWCYFFVSIEAERTNFQLLIRPPLNHVVIYIFKFIVWCRNYFGSWSFRSIRMIYAILLRWLSPGNIKGGVMPFRPLFFTWPIPAAGRPYFNTRERIQHLCHFPLRDHSFIYSFPPMTNWTSKLQAECLIPAQLFTTVLLLLFVRLTVQGDFISTEIKVFELSNISRQLICSSYS